MVQRKKIVKNCSLLKITYNVKRITLKGGLKFCTGIYSSILVRNTKLSYSVISYYIYTQQLSPIETIKFY